MTKIILFNGPPRSGKDTAAYLLNQWLKASGHKCTIAKFAHPLKLLTGVWARMMNIPAADLLDHPDTTHNALFGMTPRQFQIAISEDLIKPHMGQSAFGFIAVALLGRDHIENGYILFSDSGFRSEILPMVKQYGPSSILLIRLHREGKDFTNDSRSYIELSDLGITEVDINNDGTTASLLISIRQAIGAWERDSNQQAGIDRTDEGASKGSGPSTTSDQ